MEGTLQSQTAYRNNYKAKKQVIWSKSVILTLSTICFSYEALASHM